MQFKHPEILYALFALAIPVFIHLFQLQKFVNTPFTNVKFLKEIQLQTRRSSQLKKWLVLLTRLGMFAALIIAFAQPYFSKNDTSKDWQTSLYLDNSISMQAKGEKGPLLKRAIQDIIKNIPEKGTYNLITNNQDYYELSKNELVQTLNTIEYTPKDMRLKSILLKQKEISKNDTYNKLLLISDFQHLAKTSKIDSSLIDNHPFDYIKLQSSLPYNISIDSVALIKENSSKPILDVYLKNQGENNKKTIVNVFKNKIVLAKNSLDIPANSTKHFSIHLPQISGNIKLQIDENDAFLYDNVFYLNLQEKEKINVLHLGSGLLFLDRIYTKDIFNFKRSSINAINYELLDKQQLILLSSPKSIDTSLRLKLSNFIKKGGSLVIIPNAFNTTKYLNDLLHHFKIGELDKKQTQTIKITNIHTNHPILQNVFDKKIQNFQHPNTTLYYETNLLGEEPILSFENQKSFISRIPKGKGFIYWIASPLENRISNFNKSPLVVPVFYNMATKSLTRGSSYYTLGKSNKIPVNIRLGQDQVLHIQGNGKDFIPLQKIEKEKVILQSRFQPKKNGFYQVVNAGKTVKEIAFNYPKEESLLPPSQDYLSNNSKGNIRAFKSIASAFSSLKEAQSVQSYFKWFILLALVFLILEILFLKYL